MMKKLFCALLILALCAAGAVAEGLTVRGTGMVSLDADTATVSLGIRQYASDVKEAQAAVNQVMDAVIAALGTAGVAREDMYTSSIYIYPEYDYDSSEGGERIRGYSAGNTLTVVTRNVDEVGAYIDAAFDAGANTLDDVSFSASDTAAAYDEAMTKAVDEARHKAEVLAKAAGLELGGIASISEGETYGSYNTPAMYARSTEADAGGATQVLAAKQYVSATVTVVFEVE